MEEEIITICKKPGIKKCIRINNTHDIPKILTDIIKIENQELVLDCLEGIEKCPLGSVIAYEKLENGKMNVWNKSNWKETTKEIDGVFYELPKPVKAIRLTDEVPRFIFDNLKDKFSILPSGEYQVITEWGLIKCAPFDGYIIIYGKKEDGSLDINFLNKSTPSFKEYYVLDDNGEIIESLFDYDLKIIKR